MQRSGLISRPAEAKDATGGRLRSDARRPAHEELELRTEHRDATAHRSKQAPSDPESASGTPQESGTTGRMPWSFSRVAMHSRDQRALLIGADSDPLEAAANRAASTPGSAAIAGFHGPQAGRPAPNAVQQALGSPGRSLDASTRRGFESRYRHDFSHVRLHTGAAAARSAEALGARAFTVGEHIVLGREGGDHGLLAHELAHVVQQSAASMPWVQCQPNTQGTPAPRKDFVFLMGKDPKGTGNPFFTMALKYFKAHIPTATFVDDKRNLADLLSWLSSNVSAPIGNIYIVSHGNEDGTLSFGLDSADTNGRMSVIELRDALHPSGGGASSLPSVSTLIDAQTRIHIKGCDIGRTQEMVELIDEAFGGAGTVTAPTHEQEYSTDPTLGARARQAAHDKDIADFTAAQPALPPKATPVDPKLKGDALKAAKLQHDADAAARKQAEDARKAALAGEEKRLKPELDKVEAEAGTVDALSGPMFQRPGTTLFKAAEIQPQVDSLYGHLSEKQRKDLTARLVAPDPGVPHDQHGQKVDRVKPFTQDVTEPASLAEAKVAYGKEFAKNNFTPKSMVKNDPTTGDDGTEVSQTFTGTEHVKGSDPVEKTWTYSATMPDDKSVISQGQAQVNNPARYQWRVERKHSASGVTTVTAIGERVIAYLHHGSLDAKAHDHFSKPESSADFYATSTFTPPPPPPASTTGTPTP
jgi:hypothetical protein